MVMVGGNVTGLPVADGAGLTAEGVPDRLASAILGDSALDLVGRGRDPPGEVDRERRNLKIAHGPDRSPARPARRERVPSGQ